MRRWNSHHYRVKRLLSQHFGGSRVHVSDVVATRPILCSAFIRVTERNQINIGEIRKHPKMISAHAADAHDGKSLALRHRSASPMFRATLSTSAGDMKGCIGRERTSRAAAV